MLLYILNGIFIIVLRFKVLLMLDLEIFNFYVFLFIVLFIKFLLYYG